MKTYKNKLKKYFNKSGKTDGFIKIRERILDLSKLKGKNYKENNKKIIIISSAA